MSPNRHSVRTVVATDVANAYDNVSHEVIIKNRDVLEIPTEITRIVRFFLRDEFTIRVKRKKFGSYSSNRVVPQAYILAPTLFNLAMTPLA